MEAVEVVYFENDTATKKIVFGDNYQKGGLFWFPAGNRIEVRCAEYFVVAGSISEPKLFVMQINNNEQVPIIDINGDPVLENGVAKTKGEYDFWVEIFFNRPSPIAMRSSMEQAIKRKLMKADENLVFEEMPGQLAFVETN